MIYKSIPSTVYYLEHEKELREKYPEMPLKKLMLVKGIYNGEPKYKKDGFLQMDIFRKMFDLNLFQEIKACQMNFLNTTEYDHINDYDTLEYNEKLCTQLIDSANEKKKEKVWSRIYYSDFQIDIILSPHLPYLSCTVYGNGENIHKISFMGEKIGEQLLDYLINGSLTYFHNLKYDACFFINCPGWSTEIAERSDTVLQIVMTKWATKELNDPRTHTKRKTRKFVKQLVFRN